MAFYDKIRGTMSAIFQLGKSGPNLKSSSGVIQNRNAADSAFTTNEAGTFKLTNAAGQSIFVSLPASSVTPYNFTLPSVEGTPNQVLVAVGSGNGTSWVDINKIPGIFDFRLSLESGVPVSTSDKVSQNTLYLVPYTGNQYSYYDGSKWVLFTYPQVSISLSGLTSGLNYDVFVYVNANISTLELVAWTNDTTRATALTTQDGVYVKSGSTNKRYVGTIRTTSTTTSEDSEVNRFVWNFYNRVDRSLYTETISLHSYSTTSFRAWNNGSSTPKVNFVTGIALDSFTYGCTFCEVALGYVGVAIDGISPANRAIFFNAINATIRGGAVVENYALLGYHYLQAVEQATASGAGTFTTAGVFARIKM